MLKTNPHPPALLGPLNLLSRMARSISLGALIILFSLGIGILGYHHFEQMDWIDAYENAAMILSGMGPVKELKTTEGKLFAGTYALFSGIIFLLTVGIIFGPLFHRFFHRLHVQEDKTK